MAAQTGNTLRATTSVVWFYTGIQVSLFNGVLSAQLELDGVKATFDSLQAKMMSRVRRHCGGLGRQSKPDNLGLLLEQYGLQPAWELPGMAINLALVDNEPEAIANFTIQKVTNAEMQMQWARIVAVGSGFPDVAIDAVVRLEAGLADSQIGHNIAISDC